MECPECKTRNQKGCCKDLKKSEITEIKMENNQELGKKRFSKIWFLFAGIVVILALVLFFTKSSSASSFENINKAEKIEIYKSITCGCCDVYSSYVDRKVDVKVNSFNVQDTEATKRQFGVPLEMESCHTTILGDYFVEGHVPLEAVEKLMAEQPDIKGIAMPGMPMGSPGMVGQKSGQFIVYAVANDGTYTEFMRI